ncbi:methyl-accepting chemotaxis protein [Bordetella trematum]|uniref:methyl-accepting chemotaxis protein n=1 Tax=Bordetella trematum TaxID=123899 RepID=UPI003D118627
MTGNLRVATALTATMAVFVLLFALGAAAGLGALNINRAHIEALGRGDIERANALSDTTARLFQARAQLTDAKTLMEGGLEEGRDEALQRAGRLLELAAESQARLAANPDEAGSGYGQVLQAYEGLALQALAPLAAAIQGWNGIQANQLVERVLPAATDAYVAAAEGYQAYARAQGQQRLAQAARVMDFMTWGALAMLLLVALLALLIRQGFRRTVLRPLGAAGQHFGRIADGDLTQRIEDRGTNEIGVLYRAMARMQGGLTQAVLSVRSGVEHMHESAGEIASGAAEMSRRAERQAAALQETAASMLRLADTVAATATHAETVNQRVGQGAQLARAGGVAVKNAVSGMAAISTSAERIGEIVGVVESIAFQTNILALNAAVEAARAGAQGKGFAVVAAEVRSLAQRSAQAAQEIKTLIDTSRERVAAGARHVAQAGEMMEGIVQAVEGVTGEVREISLACAQQAADIAAVNAAVAQVDQDTQENAAMAEQTAAAAQTLEAQGQALREAVAVFRLQAPAAPKRSEPVQVGLDHHREVALLDLALDMGGR